MKVIFAQGNPEPEYASTRHNVGFEVLNALAEENGLKWSEKAKFKAFITEYSHSGEKIILAKPTTYYNETGQSIKAIVDFYKIDIQNDLFVIHDDLALPFNTVRTRYQGGDAGNNGIKSISSHLSSNYHRIRIGIDNDMREKMGDADFVLAKFSAAEKKQFEQNTVPYVIGILEDFCSGLIKITSQIISE